MIAQSPARPAARLLPVLLAVMALAGCGRSGDEASRPTQVAARVNKSEISVHQVNHVLQRQPGLRPEQVDVAGRQVLENLIEQEMAVQKAVELKLDHDPDVVASLAGARRDVLARAYAERVAGSSTKPTAADVQAYFDGKPALFAQRRVYTLQEAVVQADAKQIDALRERVRSAKAIQDVSDYLKSQGLPVRMNQSTAAAEALPLPLAETLLRAKPGQALFLPAPGGARIVVVGRIDPAPLTLAQAQPAIEQVLVAERRRKAVETEMRTLRQAGQIEYVGKFAQAAASAPQAPAPLAANPAPAAAKASAPGTQDGAAAVDTDLLRKGLGTAAK